MFRPLPKLPLGDLAAHLPRDYVAVKFYANSALPDTAANRALTAQVLEDLTRDDRRRAAEHRTPLRRSHRLRAGAARSPAYGRAPDAAGDEPRGADAYHQQRAAFVGTYGGFSYLAPFCGTSTVAFYSNPTAFRFDHLEVSKRVFSSLKSGSFVPLDVKDLDVVRLALGRVDQVAAGRRESARKRGKPRADRRHPEAARSAHQAGRAYRLGAEAGSEVADGVPAPAERARPPVGAGRRGAAASDGDWRPAVPPEVAARRGRDHPGAVAGGRRQAPDVRRDWIGQHRREFRRSSPTSSGGAA